MGRVTVGYGRGGRSCALVYGTKPWILESAVSMHLSLTGYGEEGRPPQIPPKSRLYFDIHLEKLIKKDEL